MSDVRLTAINPADSSIVPVSCNAAGELLVAKPVITEINNDLTVNGFAWFAGDVTTSGKFVSDRPGGAFALWQGKNNGTKTSEILSDGSATFAGNVSAPNINTFVRVLRERISASESLEEMRNSILHALEALEATER